MGRYSVPASLDHPPYPCAASPPAPLRPRPAARRGTALTCSDDGTLRVWDMWELQQRTVIKPQLAKPGRVAVTACAFSTDGRLIAGGLMDGTIQLWDVKGGPGCAALWLPLAASPCPPLASLLQ